MSTSLYVLNYEKWNFDTNHARLQNWSQGVTQLGIRISMQQGTKVNAEIKHKLWRTVRRFGEAFRPNIKQGRISKPNVAAGNKIKFQQQLYTSI